MRDRRPGARYSRPRDLRQRAAEERFSDKMLLASAHSIAEVIDMKIQRLLESVPKRSDDKIEIRSSDLVASLVTFKDHYEQIAQSEKLDPLEYVDVITSIVVTSLLFANTQAAAVQALTESEPSATVPASVHDPEEKP